MEDFETRRAIGCGVGGAPGWYTCETPAAKRLRDLSLNTSSTRTAFLYGRLHALKEARAEQSQQHFDDTWKAAGRKSLHRWLR